MSEEQNDSPAFRLRPRRAAPKSYYTVRLEYSANPAAFIRERPRGGSSGGGSGSKRKVFTQKSGSNSTKSAVSNQDPGHIRVPTILTKEEREREERRAALHREISDSITTNTLISPFIERLQLDELEPDSVYEHNYITLRVKEVQELSNGHLLYCLCQSVDSPTISQSDCVNVYLYDEYALGALVKPDKIISIAKFRTGLSRGNTEESRGETIQEQEGDTTCRAASPSNDSNGHTADQYRNTDLDSLKSTAITMTASQHNDATKISTSVIKREEESYQTNQDSKGHAVKHEPKSESTSKSSSVKDKNTLPFDVIVKYDELVVRSTSNSNRGTPNPIACSSIGMASVNRRPLIPFVSITDMIDLPTEPFVEMSTSSPPSKPI